MKWLNFGVATLVLALFAAACGREPEVVLPETHTFAAGEYLVLVSAALCGNPDILDERGEGRWRRWLVPAENGELNDRRRWSVHPQRGTDILIRPGETYAVPQNLCAPVGTALLARVLFAALVVTIIGLAAALWRRRHYNAVFIGPIEPPVRR